MGELDRKVLEALRTLRRTYKRVYAWQIAIEIEKSERTARYRLCNLEQAGLVDRPNGKQSGWILVSGRAGHVLKLDPQW